MSLPVRTKAESMILSEATRKVADDGIRDFSDTGCYQDPELVGVIPEKRKDLSLSPLSEAHKIIKETGIKPVQPPLTLKEVLSDLKLLYGFKVHPKTAAKVLRKLKPSRWERRWGHKPIDENYLNGKYKNLIRCAQEAHIIEGDIAVRLRPDLQRKTKKGNPIPVSDQWLFFASKGLFSVMGAKTSEGFNNFWGDGFNENTFFVQAHRAAVHGFAPEKFAYTAYFLDHWKTRAGSRLTLYHIKVYELLMTLRRERYLTSRMDKRYFWGFLGLTLLYFGTLVSSPTAMAKIVYAVNSVLSALFIG